MSNAIEFAAFKAARDALESQARAASDRLRAIPGINSGRMGLTPDSVKFSPEFRKAKSDYDSAHKALRALNRGNLKRFARELRMEREARRARQG